MNDKGAHCIGVLVYRLASAMLLTLYLKETPFNAFANRADPDQAALVRAA